MPTSGIMFFEFLAFSWFFVFNNQELSLKNFKEIEMRRTLN